ncbi:hypothetical protein [Actinokineospora iranica]|uniref:Uncharacterized protein n=1 Tax=Actinokineospora iranica TaxID=1271860 RepID=A0A1G6TD15_9PSEU|nr:hypothetical protein [Actinokineospora iranica]SDD26754.1 hypothetical protein SAMN05216174_10979 [Actinokineospora iranica]
MADQQPVSRTGTAKALVLLASAALFAAGGVVCFLLVVFGPALVRGHGSPVAAAVAYSAITLLTVATAVVLAIRALTTRRTVLLGCGTLVVGTLLAVGAMLVLLTV